MRIRIWGVFFCFQVPSLRSPSEKLVAEVAAFATHSDANVRAAVIGAVISFPPTKARKILLQLSKDETDIVRERARLALLGLEGN